MRKIKEHNPEAKVGMTHALHEWDDSDTSVQKEYIQYHMEDKFLYASDEDDFIAKFLTFKTISVTSSRTPLIDENSCKTPSIWIAVTAVPLIDDNNILLKEFPKVSP